MNKHIIFIHGLGGDINKTWGKFPQFISDDSEIEHRVIMYGYTSPNLFHQFFKSAPSLLNIANGLLSDLKTRCDLEKDDIILVGHSLGGLVIRKLLLRLKAKRINHNISKVCFFDVPHEGSSLANIGKYIAWSNRHIKALVNNSSELDDLNEQWVDQQIGEQLNILSIIDANETVVSSMSSKSIFRTSQLETINGVNHSSIVKPADKDDLAVLLLKSFIKDKASIGKLNPDGSKLFVDWLKYDERRHAIKYHEDDKRKKAYQALSNALRSNNPFVRLTGLSGLGKSRLLLEYKNRNKLDDRDILIFNGAENESVIKKSITQVAEKEADGLIIIDNCPIKLHEFAINAIKVNNSELKIVTTYFYDEKGINANDTIHIRLETLNQKQIASIIDSRLPNLEPRFKSQLEKFIEGFPLLADMATKELLRDGSITTQFSESDLVEKLINGDGKLEPQCRELLQVLSLFDFFRFEKKSSEDVNLDAEFINSIAKTDQITFEKTVSHFNQREIIICTGRIARVVPKPLALNLAVKWWESSAYDRQSEIILNLPDKLHDSFCNQIKYLDSSINVQSFVEKFGESNRPFGQAELLLSKQGSRLFRALVEVNPEATSNQLYHVIKNLNDQEILNITGDVRRNLVWALEMLVFHSKFFQKNAWCLFKLAQFENESYGNNASGQFSQIYQVQLSGTEADLNQRIKILNKAFDLKKESSNIVIVKAISSAINTHGVTRTLGAEFQGTKNELKEWEPSNIQQVFDYWDSLFNILINLVKQGNQVAQIKQCVGSEIRGLIRIKQFQKLDYFVREIIKLSGKYWPAAAQSISHSLTFDQEELDDEQISFLKSWELLLTPDSNNLEEQIKLIVLDPSKEYKEDNTGGYIDVAAKEAEELAKEISDRLPDVARYFNLLTTFEVQKQTWVFAYHLALNSKNIDDFLNDLLDFFRANSRLNVQFLSGFLYGLHKRSPKNWESIIDLFVNDPELIEYFADAIRTGKFSAGHLDSFIDLIREGRLESKSAESLTYGRATEHLNEAEIADFCSKLGKIDHVGVWVALNNLYMYSFGDRNVDSKVLNPVLSDLLVKASFKNENRTRNIESHHWLESAKKLLNFEGPEFAIKLCAHIIKEVKENDIDYSDLWRYLNSAFYLAIENHGEKVWSKVSDLIISDDPIEQFKLKNLISSRQQPNKRDKNIFDLLPENVVIDWCKNNDSLLFVGSSISIFITKDETRQINPLLVSLISKFGDNKLLISEISGNFFTRSWVGSPVPSLQDDKKLISVLVKHENQKVKSWAVSFVEQIQSHIEHELQREAEDDFVRR